MSGIYIYHNCSDRRLDLPKQVDIDFAKEPIGKGKGGKDVFLKDIWPSTEEIAKVHNPRLLSAQKLVYRPSLLSLHTMQSKF